MKTQTFQLVFEADPQGGSTVTVPALPGCITYGKDMPEARAMAREAIELYLEDMAATASSFAQSTSAV